MICSSGISGSSRFIWLFQIHRHSAPSCLIEQRSLQEDWYKVRVCILPSAIARVHPENCSCSSQMKPHNNAPTACYFCLDTASASMLLTYTTRVSCIFMYVDTNRSSHRKVVLGIRHSHGIPPHEISVQLQLHASGIVTPYCVC